MSEPMLCPLTGAYCSENGCPLYHSDTLQCKFIMAVENILGTYTEGAKPKREETHPLIPKTLKPFPTLEPGKFLQELTGEVVNAPEIREVNTKNGPKQIANFEFTDGKSKIRVGIWEELLGEIKNLRSGDVITLKGMSIRPPYKGVEQISSTRNTKIE